MSSGVWFFLAGAATTAAAVVLAMLVRQWDPLAARPDDVLVYKRVPVGELKLHAFHPSGRSPRGANPAIMFFHGGRWRFGSPEGYHPQCRFFAAEGFSCFSVHYRLGADARVDVRLAVEDARDAFDYLLAHAREFGIDPDRIAVGGGSSGGHLAATLGVPVPLTRDRAGGDRRPGAMVLYNPMLDLSPCRPDHHLVADYWRDISPQQHIDHRVPPTLILLGTEDPELPVSSAEAFCDAVREQGGRCELALYEGQTHGFFNLNNSDGIYFEQTNRRILAFLRELWPRRSGAGQ